MITLYTNFILISQNHGYYTKKNSPKKIYMYIFRTNNKNSSRMLLKKITCYVKKRKSQTFLIPENRRARFPNFDRKLELSTPWYSDTLSPCSKSRYLIDTPNL